MRLKFVGGSFAVYVVMAACAGRAPTPEVGSYAPPAVGGGASGGMPSGAGGLPGIGGMVAQPGEMTGGAQMGASEKPTLELWDRALRWLERLRALSNRPLYDADFDFAVAWDVSDHALAVLGCCDSMRDWLRKSDKSLADAVTKLYASANLRACRDVVNTAKHLWISRSPLRGRATLGSHHSNDRRGARASRGNRDVAGRVPDHYRAADFGARPSGAAARLVPRQERASV